MKSISIYAVTRNQNIGHLQSGTATIRKGVFSENAYMGTGEYEISCP